jgi:uncharacterized membrane protein (UPF0127 family)
VKVIKDKKMLYAGLILLTIAFGILVYFSRNRQSAVELKEKLSVQEKKIIKDIKIDGNTVTVEVANSRHKKQRGLMYRENLPENEGMLFLFGLEGYYTFWMKNTLIPLDIIWTNSNLDIVHIEKNLQSCISDPCEGYTPPSPARYVIELNGGWVDRNNVELGDKIEIDSETREEFKELEEFDAPDGIPFFN